MLPSCDATSALNLDDPFHACSYNTSPPLEAHWLEPLEGLKAVWTNRWSEPDLVLDFFHFLDRLSVGGSPLNSESKTTPRRYSELCYA